MKGQTHSDRSLIGSICNSLSTAHAITHLLVFSFIRPANLFAILWYIPRSQNSVYIHILKVSHTPKRGAFGSHPAQRELRFHLFVSLIYLSLSLPHHSFHGFSHPLLLLASHTSLSLLRTPSPISTLSFISPVPDVLLLSDYTDAMSSSKFYTPRTHAGSCTYIHINIYVKIYICISTVIGGASYFSVIQRYRAFKMHLLIFYFIHSVLSLYFTVFFLTFYSFSFYHLLLL